MAEINTTEVQLNLSGLTNNKRKTNQVNGLTNNKRQNNQVNSLTNNQKRQVAKANADAEKARKKAKSNLKAAKMLGYNVQTNTAKRLQILEKEISNMSKTDPSYVKQYLIPEQRELRRRLGVRNKTYGEMGKSAISTYGRAPLSAVKEGLRIAKAGLTEIRNAPVNEPSRIGSLYLNEPAERNKNKSLFNMGRSTVKAVASSPRGVVTGLKEVWRSGWNALDEIRYNTPGAPSRMNYLYRNTTKKAEKEFNEQRKKNINEANKALKEQERRAYKLGITPETMANLEKLIEKRNKQAKYAEEDLILFIKNRPTYMSKNDFKRGDVISTIEDIKKNLAKIDNNTYPKLFEWNKLDNDINVIIKKIPLSYYNKSNSNKNAIISEAKNHGIDVDAILKKLPQRSVLNRLPKFPNFSTISTRKNKANPDLSTQQNPQNTLSIRPAEGVQPVPTYTPSKSSWWPFGGRRKTNRKPSGSRGGNFFKSNKSLDEIMAEKKIAENAVEAARNKYNSTNNSNPRLKTEHSNALQKALMKVQTIEDAQHKAEDEEAQKTQVTKSWYQFWGGTHRKTHHKKRHMRKGSRKIHRK